MTSETQTQHDAADADNASGDAPEGATNDRSANDDTSADAATDAAPDAPAEETAAAADAGDDGSTDDPIAAPDDLQARLERLEDEKAQLNDRLLRTAAEFENFRRRSQKQKERRYEAGKVDAIRSMLDVLDDFERSVDAADQMEEVQDLETAYASLKGGIEMVVQKFRDELKGLGVTPIEAEGEPFDEAVHEAMMQQPASDDTEPGTVVQEIRKGYRLNDRVIRHSRVIVAMDDE